MRTLKKTMMRCAVAAGLGLAAMLVESAVAAPEGERRSVTSVSRGHVQDLGVDQIRRALVRSLEGLLRDHQGELHVRVVQPSVPLRIPSGRVDIQVLSGGSDLELGRLPFHVTVSVDGRRVQGLDVVADVEVLEDLITPIRAINVDETITADDVTHQRVSLPSLTHDFARTADEVVGKRASHPLRAQAPIRVSGLGHAYAVRKGDHVTIEARRGGLTITASGVTKGVALIGQTVSVTNQDSGKEVRGKVVGPGLVRVEF
jgi:flagella basal body P-ring formation protein FlgA